MPRTTRGANTPTPTPTFAEFVESEKQRLNDAKSEVMERRKAIEQEVEAIEKELRAINAYVTAKEGPTKPTTRPGRAPGELRTKLQTLLRENPSGLLSREIFEELGLKGDPKGEKRISNLLSILKKKGIINHSEENRKYTMN